MNNEYIIVDRTKILKRIEELESKLIPNPNNDFSIDSYNLLYIAKQNALHEFLSNSRPLIPEIEKAYIAGMEFIGEDKGSPNEYISNLKIDL
jgi:hypothetical protein